MKYEKYAVSGRKSWRWRLRADNGRIISTSRETYMSERDCDYSILLSKLSSDALVTTV